MEKQQHCDMELTNSLSRDGILAELVAMGFELPVALQAVETVGQSLSDAVEFILTGNLVISRTGGNSISDKRDLLNRRSGGESAVGEIIGCCTGVHALKQSLITEKFRPTRECHNSGSLGVFDDSLIVGANPSCEYLKERTLSHYPSRYEVGSEFEDPRQRTLSQDKVRGMTSCALEEMESKWEQKAEFILQKYFGFTALKSFQKEALKAWAAHQDCLVLAATGSGKSLCFQLPALMTGKVVVVVSPLISLMHDQCWKLARHGVSACFLGSGQVDKSVEDKAMAGMYNIVYVCPETLLRLVESLQMLAENRGIALFAIDEVHCVSKWGHDFRRDYRRLSILREKFKASNFISAKHDIPIMALTATATHRVREDILCSLGIKATAKIVLTSFFRPNLRFSVHHSKTTQFSSYEADFQELIISYTDGRRTSPSKSNNKTKVCLGKAQCVVGNKKKIAAEDASDSDKTFFSESESCGEETDDHDLDVNSAANYDDVQEACEDHQMTIEFLEDENDEQMAEDFDETCGEFKGVLLEKDKQIPEHSLFKTDDQSVLKEEKFAEGLGPSIIYTPTRKETEKLAKFLCKSGVKAAAYHAKLPKKHLREVHEQFHNNSVQANKDLFWYYLFGARVKPNMVNVNIEIRMVVVATIAFGMGIDKTNVRRIIHYGWPQPETRNLRACAVLPVAFITNDFGGLQKELVEGVVKVFALTYNRNLEAYYQEAGRAGRDGVLADCTLYVDMTRLPSLLPSKRDAEQTQHALTMLAECFRYGVSTTCCRAKTLVQYFGEDLIVGKCRLCDICVKGPPKCENLGKEAEILLRVLVELQSKVKYGSLDLSGERTKKLHDRGGHSEIISFREVNERLREQYEEGRAKNTVWWRGFARMLEDIGFIREVANDGSMQTKQGRLLTIKYPEPTNLGLEFLRACDHHYSYGVGDHSLYLIPEGDMLQAMRMQDLSVVSHDWGRGWADPEIRRQRLKGRRKRGKKRKRSSKNPKPNKNTVRGRISAKLSRKR